jgi:hypothetical protein
MGACKKEKFETPVVLPKKTQLTIVTEDKTEFQKQEIEKMKKVISEKIKNPELARKAALIISEMINNK